MDTEVLYFVGFVWEWQVAQLLSRLARFADEQQAWGVPVILTGDLNATKFTHMRIFLGSKTPTKTSRALHGKLNCFVWVLYVRHSGACGTRARRRIFCRWECCCWCSSVIRS